MVGYLSLWHVGDEQTGGIVCPIDNPMEFAQTAKAGSNDAQEPENLTDDATKWPETVGKHF